MGGRLAGNGQALLAAGPNRQSPPDNSPHNICQSGIYHTLSRPGYTPVLMGTRATDVSSRDQTAGIGAHIYGLECTHWGKVVAEEHSAWRLAGGLIAKRKTEQINWEWGPKHASEFPVISDDTPGTDCPQPDYPFSPCQERTYVDDKATVLTRLTHQSSAHPNYTHNSTPDTDDDRSPHPGRVEGSNKHPRANSITTADTIKEVTIW